jgi:hypothetical protein
MPELLRMAQQADRDGLDIFSLSDHPYLGGRLDAYAAVGFVLGGTRRLAGFANVTSLPLRPPAMLLPASGPRNSPEPSWSTGPQASCSSLPREARPTPSR